MKPCNFPVNKAARQLRVLDKLDPKSDAYKHLQSKILANPRDIRTKKVRTGLRGKKKKRGEE